MTFKRKLALWFIVLGGLLTATAHNSQALRLYQADECARNVLTVAALAWLAGNWEQQSAQQVREMHWSNPGGGTLLGFGRVLINEQTAGFEFMRLHETPDALWLTIKADNQPEATFRLTQAEATTASFANATPPPAYPQRLSYRLETDGTLVMRLESARAGQPQAQQFSFRRVHAE